MSQILGGHSIGNLANYVFNIGLGVSPFLVVPQNLDTINPHPVYISRLALHPDRWFRTQSINALSKPTSFPAFSDSSHLCLRARFKISSLLVRVQMEAAQGCESLATPVSVGFRERRDPPFGPNRFAKGPIFPRTAFAKWDGARPSRHLAALFSKTWAPSSFELISKRALESLPFPPEILDTSLNSWGSLQFFVHFPYFELGRVDKFWNETIRGQFETKSRLST